MYRILCLAAALATVAPLARAGTAVEEANKKTVIAFYKAAIDEKDFAAASRYLGQRYTQHNPTVPDGPAGLERFIEFLRDKFPNEHNDIKQVFADGDYVILHVHAVGGPGDRGAAVVDIYKLEDGKIVEHWDVIQPIPEQSANGNGMF